MKKIKKMLAVLTVAVIAFALFGVSAFGLAVSAEETGSAQIVQLADDEDGGGGGGGGGGEAEAAFGTVMEMIINWIRIIGGCVALFGGVMLALALKNKDGDQKEAGMTTMVAGFVAIAVTTAIDWLAF
jgi:hypothetical protein